MHVYLIVISVNMFAYANNQSHPHIGGVIITFPPTMLIPNDLFWTRSSMTSLSWPHDASSVYGFLTITSIVVMVRASHEVKRKKTKPGRGVERRKERNSVIDRWGRWKTWFKRKLCLPCSRHCRHSNRITSSTSPAKFSGLNSKTIRGNSPRLLILLLSATVIFL